MCMYIRGDGGMQQGNNYAEWNASSKAGNRGAGELCFEEILIMGRCLFGRSTTICRDKQKKRKHNNRIMQTKKIKKRGRKRKQAEERERERASSIVSWTAHYAVIYNSYGPTLLRLRFSRHRALQHHGSSWSSSWSERGVARQSRWYAREHPPSQGIKALSGCESGVWQTTQNCCTTGRRRSSRRSDEKADKSNLGRRLAMP